MMRNSPKKSSQYYWYCQGIGWTIYTFISFTFFTLAGSATTRLFIYYTIVSLTGFGLTHGYRYLIQRWGWTKLNAGQITLRIFPASILLGISWFMIDSLAWLVLKMFTDNPTPMSFRLAFGVIFNTSVVALIWSLLYFGWHYFNNYKQAEIDHWRMASIAQEAQLAALKSQINPHFMFNALNNIRALILEDQHKAREMLTALSELMRYALNYSQAKQVSLEDEMYIVDSYLQLASIQFEDRLHFSKQIDDALMEVQIPPMLLQTLVENSIKHGIAHLPEGGEVKLSGSREANEVKLIIENTGQFRPQSPTEKGQSKNTGTGLKNATERLKMLYGELASIRLTQQNNFVTATVTIPQ
ncbi:MAG TPA: hypothetical protein DCS93_42080 [Microscillaceae bacterium]|nr:hypothetical protein [Microscillaceae bacterium]